MSHFIRNVLHLFAAIMFGGTVFFKVLILDPFGDEMGDDAIALDPSGHAHQPPGNHRFAKRGIDGFPDHHIGHTGFIFEGRLGFNYDPANP